MREDLYYDAGRMIGLSLVHGGPAPGFFSKMLFNCVLYGPENIVPTLEDLADACAKQKVKKVTNLKAGNKNEDARSMFLFFSYKYGGLGEATEGNCQTLEQSRFGLA